MIWDVAPNLMFGTRYIGGTGSLTPCQLLVTLMLAVGLPGGHAAAPDTDRPKADHWAFKQSVRPPIPKVKNAGWARNPIDAFVLARLEAERLAPSPEADRITLIRRLSFDLTGLPPTPEEARQFASDTSPDAYEKLVDRLLGSPRYGERWARHWLDTVHYGETHGYDKDKPRSNAWPYRDFVIRAFNEDEPYSLFVQQQLAGDVLFPDSAEGVVATGFLAAGPWDYVGHVELPETKTDGLIARYNDRDDMIMNAMSTFLSLTVHCARCHDHKFDPISQEEYYGLQAVFAGVDRADRPFDTDLKTAARRRQLTAERAKCLARQKAIDEMAAKVTSPEIAHIDSRLSELKQLKAESATLEQERQQRVEEQLDAATKSERAQIRRQLYVVDKEIDALPKPRMVYAAANDFAPSGSFVPPRVPRPVHLLKRGDGHLEIADANDEGSRRAALALWMTDRRNMPARRSIVNRVWQYHFGRGIVETPNDFGHMGAAPTHPELLDWLAYWFLDNGESLKQLHKLIVTSATYRQTSRNDPARARLDGDNRFLWRMNRQRLDAEAFRDTLLCLGGKLDLTMGGPSVRQFFFKDDHSPGYDYAQFDVNGPGSSRRSIYRFIVRSVPDPFMEALDCPDANLLTPKRNVTLTALQALSTLNDAFVLRQYENFAARLQRERADLPKQIERACQLALSRTPRPDEAGLLLVYANKHGLTNACRVLLNGSEFVFVD
ncbi:MAG: hypothetical protein DME19_09165 [Verrucomicrobia bacterium]|nr:MAG: hypothetical protein DME19_09165 [Verrucomicrobiota bacterium]